MTEEQKGFTCDCGKRNDYPGYVFTHFREVLIFTCDCGQKYTIHNGYAVKEENITDVNN